MLSVATLNFLTKDCDLDDGSWINLDLMQMVCVCMRSPSIQHRPFMTAKITFHGILIGRICKCVMVGVRRGMIL